jgi:hypothetical protein
VALFWHVYSWHPPVGVFIAILAVLGVVVPLVRRNVGPREKAVWTAVMFLLMLMEIKSIYQDRAHYDKEHADARKEELDRFDKIANGITTTITISQSQFNATMMGMSNISNNLGLNSRELNDLAQGKRKQDEEFRLKRKALNLSSGLLQFIVNWESQRNSLTPVEPPETHHSPQYRMSIWRKTVALDSEMKAKAITDFQPEILGVLNRSLSLGEDITGVSDSMIKSAIEICTNFPNSFAITQCANGVGEVGREMR